MISEPVLMDTGPLIALYSEVDSHHTVCTEQMASLPVGKVYTCWPVITEAAYMLRKRPEQRTDLLQAVINGELSILRLRDRDIKPVRDIFAKYHDQQIDFADACLLHLADRENIEAIFTIDRRHFGILRKLNGQMLRILPEG